MKRSDIALIRSRVASSVPVPIYTLVIQKVTDKKVIMEVGCQMIEAGVGEVSHRVPWGPGVSQDDVVNSLSAGLRHRLERYHQRGPR